MPYFTMDVKYVYTLTKPCTVEKLVADINAIPKPQFLSKFWKHFNLLLLLYNNGLVKDIITVSTQLDKNLLKLLDIEMLKLHTFVLCHSLELSMEMSKLNMVYTLIDYINIVAQDSGIYLPNIVLIHSNFTELFKNTDCSQKSIMHIINVIGSAFHYPVVFDTQFDSLFPKIKFLATDDSHTKIIQIMMLSPTILAFKYVCMTELGSNRDLMLKQIMDFKYKGYDKRTVSDIYRVAFNMSSKKYHTFVDVLLHVCLYDDLVMNDTLCEMLYPANMVPCDTITKIVDVMIRGTEYECYSEAIAYFYLNCLKTDVEYYDDASSSDIVKYVFTKPTFDKIISLSAKIDVCRSRFPDFVLANMVYTIMEAYKQINKKSKEYIAYQKLDINKLVLKPFPLDYIEVSVPYIYWSVMTMFNPPTDTMMACTELPKLLPIELVKQLPLDYETNLYFVNIPCERFGSKLTQFTIGKILKPFIKKTILNIKNLI